MGTLSRRYAPGSGRHDQLLREVIERHQGHVFKTVGDAFFAAFPTACDALEAALEVHLVLLEQAWAETGPLRVRMGLHTGAAEERDNDYFGPTLSRVARLQGAGHGQQTLLSQTTYSLVCHTLPADVTLQDMGQHRLKNLLAPEHVWQLLHPSLPSEFPPLRSLDNLPTNLPRQMTSFIGRKREMQEVKRLLPSTPLLTLVGTGGAGKTRLALQVGAEVLDHYKDGVWLVELAALSDPGLVSQAVAIALGVREEVGRNLLQTLQDYLRDRRLLLLLDNCEHLLHACAVLADTLLKNCSHLSILATSREALRVAGERTWRVPSLLTPNTDKLPLEEKDLVMVLMEYDAPHLFVERAVMQRQDFVLTRRNVSAVALLCQKLDGIPLAIELAAARIRSLSVEEINDRLENRFHLLNAGSRTVLPRQQTLRGLLDWSYDLLNEQEKRLLGWLSVFAGGWTLQATEQVCTGEGIEQWEVLDLLTSLVDKSLIVVEQKQEQNEEHIRYRLLETIRQYAQDRLREGEEDEAVHSRHQAFFLALAEAAEPQLTGPEEAAWLHRLEREYDNLRQALEWGNKKGDNQHATLRLAGALYQFWDVRGYLSEGRDWLARALAGADTQVPLHMREKALDGAGGLAYSQGDYMAARLFAQECLVLRREAEDSLGISRSLHSLGNLSYVQGDYATAYMLYTESLALKRQLGDKQGIAYSLNSLGTIASNQGDYATARISYTESLALHRELGNTGGIAESLVGLGIIAHDQGDFATARRFYEESLALSRELGDKRGIAYSLNSLGNVAAEQNDFATARILHIESLTLMREVGNKRGIIYSLESFAYLASAQEQAQRGAHLWGAAKALREALNIPPPPSERSGYDRKFARIRAALSEEAFAAAWSEGCALRMEQAINYALEEAGV